MMVMEHQLHLKLYFKCLGIKKGPIWPFFIWQVIKSKLPAKLTNVAK